LGPKDKLIAKKIRRYRPRHLFRSINIALRDRVLHW
jgi:hypothetical protein